ncbi:MAG: aminotransferase class IV [Bacteroidota bacterium]|nr:aminotransferase class IV [Bacteroidota bacterium]
MNFLVHNEKYFTSKEPVLMADNRSYRYGDGLFETIKVINGNIILQEYHFERLFSGLRLLKFEIPKLFTAGKIRDTILALCKKNNCEKLARVRLSVFRGHGGLYDGEGQLQYLIECWPLDETVNRLNEKGLVIDIFPDARKSCDVFSNLKSTSYLLYVMAAIHAKENKLNDCFVMNMHERICDTTIANIFRIKDSQIFTSPLSEGCVAGVLRRYLIERIPGTGYEMREENLTVKDLENADEVFLTNTIKGIRWVKQFRNSTFSNNITADVNNQFIVPLFS